MNMLLETRKVVKKYIMKQTNKKKKQMKLPYSIILQLKLHYNNFFFFCFIFLSVWKGITTAKKAREEEESCVLKSPAYPATQVTTYPEDTSVLQTEPSQREEPINFKCTNLGTRSVDVAAQTSAD